MAILFNDSPWLPFHINSFVFSCQLMQTTSSYQGFPWWLLKISLKRKQKRHLTYNYMYADLSSVQTATHTIQIVSNHSIVDQKKQYTWNTVNSRWADTPRVDHLLHIASIDMVSAFKGGLKPTPGQPPPYIKEEYTILTTSTSAGLKCWRTWWGSTWWTMERR